MPRNIIRRSSIGLFALLLLSAPLLSGCAAALIAGGAVGGYAVATHLENDKKMEEAQQQGNKGWFGGGK
jgi:hypothetical protein